jgi:hypothetical protein
LFNKQTNPQPQRLLTAEEIEVRVWAVVVIVVTFILAGIVAYMLYSLGFITQPLKSMAPMDQAFAKMLNDIVLLIVGGIGGVMSRKGVQAVADKMSAAHPVAPPPQPQAVAPSPSPAPTAPSGMFDFNFGGFKNPELDETWRAPPPPTTPADFVDPAVEDIAHERAAARAES